MNKILDSFKLSVNCDLANLDIIRDFVNKIAYKNSLDEEKIGQIEIAVDEACTNVMKHACHYDQKQKIHVLVKIKKSSFIVEIIDRGEGNFDPDSVEEVKLDEFVKNRRHGGLGLHLMKNLMDDVKFYIGSSNQNRVRMTKKI